MNIASISQAPTRALNFAAPKPPAGLPVSSGSDGTIEQLRRLALAIGSTQLGGKVDKLAAQKKSREEFAARIQIELSTQQQAEVSGFVEGTGPVPGFLNPDQQKCLDDLKNLSERGVQFCKHDFSPLSPGQASLNLLQHPQANSLREREQVVNYVSETEFMGKKGLTTVNLRPQTLGALRFFLDKSLEGLSFVGTDKKPITQATQFVFEYGDEPRQALVNKAGGNWTYQYYQEELARTAQELAQVSAPPIQMVETADHVNIGGIVLKKKGRPKPE